MRRPLTDSEVIGACLGAIGAMVVAGLLGSVRTEVSQANCALMLAIVIIAAASVGGRWAGVFTALAAAMSFDFFLTRPYGSLAIKSSDDVIATGLLVFVGLAVGTIAKSRADARAHGAAGTAEVAGLHRVAQMATEGASLSQVIDAVERELCQLLSLRSCQFRLLPEDPPLPELEPTGRIKAPYVHIGHGFALPAEGVSIAVRNGGRILGWLVCEPKPGLVGISLDRRRTAVVFADHLGLVLAQSDADAA